MDAPNSRMFILEDNKIEDISENHKHKYMYPQGQFLRHVAENLFDSIDILMSDDPFYNAYGHLTKDLIRNMKIGDLRALICCFTDHIKYHTDLNYHTTTSNEEYKYLDTLYNKQIKDLKDKYIKEVEEEVEEHNKEIEDLKDNHVKEVYELCKDNAKDIKEVKNIARERIDHMAKIIFTKTDAININTPDGHFYYKKDYFRFTCKFCDFEYGDDKKREIEINKKNKICCLECYNKFTEEDLIVED